MAKSKEPIEKNETILPLSMEEAMHSAMMPYAEYVILERALPRVEDGLKPVQRRILYTMLELSLSPDKPHRKSARIVGDTLGKYHPHGDTSVYDAMVRMAQDFNMRMPLVDGHGNFGSIDGDSAAAMRYTEARLSPIAMELLQAIEKETVPWRLNFDDTMKEPDMLPARFPNLLVNGASGIAVGLATNIPPHNLGEVIDGVVARIKNPQATLSDIMRYIKAPDFPTGGFVMSREEIEKAYETGKGRLTLRAKTHIESGGNGKQRIVVTELPYQVNKAAMLEKILALSEQKREMFAGIADIRDESDRTGMRAVIEVKNGADAEKILQYLYKYSDLQTNYSVNMVAIADGQPKLMPLLDILDYYIAFQKDVVTRRTQYDLEKAKQREHILAGLIIAVNNIDRVIKIIRSSKNPGEARTRLMQEFNLTQIQAQAILDMRLARLTALEIESLEREYREVLELIAKLEAILASEKLLLKVIVNEHMELRDKYADERRTVILDDEPEIVINEDDFKTVEECILTLTKNGLLKRLSPKSFQKGMEAGTVDDDNEAVWLLNTRTDKKLHIFTNLGNLAVLSVEAIPESKWKDKGTAVNALMAGLSKGEEIAALYCFEAFPENEELLFATKHGMVKRVALPEFEIKKSRMQACGLKDGDEVLAVERVNKSTTMLFATKSGMAIHIKKEEIPVVGRTAKGVIGIKLEAGDEVMLATQTEKDMELIACSERGYAKRTPVKEFELQNRAGKGQRAFGFQKNAANGTALKAAFCTKGDEKVVVTLKSGEKILLKACEVPRGEKNGRGCEVAFVLLDNVVERLYRPVF